MTGVCPECRHVVKLRKGGTTYRHSRPGGIPCPGSHRLPKEDMNGKFL